MKRLALLFALPLLFTAACQPPAPKPGTLFQEHLRRGRELLAAGNYGRARFAFAQARALLPTHEEVTLLGHVAAIADVAVHPEVINDQNINEVDYLSDLLLPRFPEHAHLIQTARGNVMARAGKAEEAIEAYRKVIEGKADFAPAHFFLGQVLDQTGKSSEAEAALKQALDADASYFAAAEYLGRVYSRRGAVEEAESVLQAAIAKGAPARTHAVRGDILLNANKANEAAAAYQGALQKDGNFAPALYRLAGLLLRAGQAEKAGPLIQRYLQVAAKAGEPGARIHEAQQTLEKLAAAAKQRAAAPAQSPAAPAPQ